MATTTFDPQASFLGPFTQTPTDIYSALVVSDLGIFDELVAANGDNPFHTSGASRMARYLSWDATGVVAPARAMIGLLDNVDHDVARKGVAAIRAGLASRSAQPDCGPYVLVSSHPFHQALPENGFATLREAWAFAGADLILRDPQNYDVTDVTFVLSDPTRSRAQIADGTTFAALSANQVSDDWSQGWARRTDDGSREKWGTYRTDKGALVRMYRGPYNRVRFYDATGTQHGVEQSNVAPGLAFVMAHGWQDATD